LFCMAYASGTNATLALTDRPDQRHAAAHADARRTTEHATRGTEARRENRRSRKTAERRTVRGARTDGCENQLVALHRYAERSR
jgi:hypothetical protein